VLHTVKARGAKVHHRPGGPVVEVRADLVTAKTVYPFRCVCAPEENHDHEIAMRDLAALIERHDAVIDDYRNHEGTKGVVNGLSYEITDCKIRILGPACFELYVSWLEDHGGGEPVRHTKTWTSETPDDHVPAKEIHRVIAEEMDGRRDRILAAHAAVAAHLEKV
jgi:hypothetical protein